MARLELIVPGAPDGRLRAGLDAATQHFIATGIDPQDAYDAYHTLTDTEMFLFFGKVRESSDKDIERSKAWMEAEDRAFAAVLGEGVEPPPGSVFRPVREGDGAASPGAAEDFAAAQRHRGEPPRVAETFYVGRDAAGEIAHFVWDEEDDPYFARLNNDEPFDPVEWAVSGWTYDEISERYF